jgi:hypothetical protein
MYGSILNNYCDKEGGAILIAGAELSQGAAHLSMKLCENDPVFRDIGWLRTITFRWN